MDSKKSMRSASGPFVGAAAGAGFAACRPFVFENALENALAVSLFDAVSVLEDFDAPADPPFDFFASSSARYCLR